MKRIILLVFILFALSLVCPAAGEYLKMVQEAEDADNDIVLTITTYISPKGYIYDWGEGYYLLFIMKESKFYVIDNDSEEYFPVENDAVKSVIDTVDEKMWGETPSVTSYCDSGGKDHINGIEVNTCMFEMKSSIMNLEIIEWISAYEYPPSLVVHKYYEELAKLQGKRGLLTLEYLNLWGSPIVIESTATANGRTVKLITRTTYISDDPIPDSLFEIPNGYVEVPADPEILLDAILQCKFLIGE